MTQALGLEHKLNFIFIKKIARVKARVKPWSWNVTFRTKQRQNNPIIRELCAGSTACVMAWQGRDVLVVCLVGPQVSQHNRQVLEHNNILQTN